jgi:hypothetical protein
MPNGQTWRAVSDDLETIDSRSSDENRRNRPFLSLTSVFLTVVSACLVVLVFVGLAILREERRQSCAMRWTLPLLLSPFPERQSGQPTTEARTGWYTASLRCFNVTP